MPGICFLFFEMCGGDVRQLTQGGQLAVLEESSEIRDSEVGLS